MQLVEEGKDHLRLTFLFLAISVTVRVTLQQPHLAFVLCDC